MTRLRRGDVLTVDLGLSAPAGGREQSGRRPAITVLSDASPAANPMAIVIPVTSRTTALRFPFTFQVEPSPANGLTSVSVILVFQLRAVDPNRIIDVIGHLEESYLRQLDELLRNMLAL